MIVAILTYDCFDEWLGDIGVSVESFCQEMVGTWQFNYIQALQCAGISCVLFFTSSKVKSTTKFIHKPTGATIYILPSSKAYRLVKKWRLGFIRTTDTANSLEYAKRLFRGALGLATSYLSTPLMLLNRELRREGCNCILVEQYEDPRFDLTVILGRLIRKPVFGIFTAIVAPQKYWTRPFRIFALKLCAGLLICAGGEVKRVIEQYGVPRRKLARIYYPVDLSVWYPSAQEEMRVSLGIPAGAKVVAYHGRIELWTKGLDVLIDAWDQICKHHADQDLRLILIGTGFDAEKLSEILAVKRLRGVTWLNQWVHDRDLLRRYLSAADVYAFPSRVDAFGIAVIEAMACGLPVVAASAPGILDILKDGEESGGLVVPTGDVEALTCAVERVLNDPRLAYDMAKSARHRVEAMFSPEVIGRQLQEYIIGELSKRHNDT